MALKKLRLAQRIAWLALVLLIGLVIAGRSGSPASEASSAEPGKKSEPPDRAEEIASEEDSAEAIAEELQNLRKLEKPVPRDLAFKAEKLIESNRVSYRLRFQLSLLAFQEERWASKHIEIIFRNEVSKRPFETIAEVFKLVPEGPIQDEVADTLSQAIARTMTPGDAPAVCDLFAGFPEGPRKVAVSMISNCLSSAGQIETLRSLEQNCSDESMKKSFAWYVGDFEKSRGIAR